MNAAELRIGNRLFNGIVTSLTKDNIVVFDGYQRWNQTDFHDGFKPIILTPIILEKCGFEWETTEHNHLVLNIEEFGQFIFYYKDGVMDTFMIHNGILETIFFKPIESLHRLQNIYFSLTGHELIITL